MPLKRMPNGEYVDVPANITPEALSRIEGQFKAKPKSRVELRNERGSAPITAEDAEVNRRVKRRESRDISGGFNAFNDTLRKGVFSSFNDEIAGGVSAGTRGVVNAISKGDIGEVGKEYRVARDTERSITRRYAERNPGTAATAEVIGAVASPLGTGSKLVRGAGNLAARAAMPRTGQVLSRVAARMDKAGPVAQGLMAGGFQGGINAAGASEDLAHLPSDMVNGALTGAALGGTLAGIGHIGQRGVQILKDRGSLGRFSGPGGEDGSRAAYARVASLLEKGDITPEQAARNLKLTDARGGDGMVMDVTPGLTSEAGYLSRQTNLPSSNKMIERGQQRWDNRRASAAQRVEENAILPKGAKDFDSYRQADEIAAGRKATGQTDYAPGGPMDKPLNWNDELDDFFTKAPKETDAAMRSAYDELQIRRDDPALFSTVNKNGEPVYYPKNFRAWDYMKRGFDEQIGAALKAGAKGKASALSDEVTRLKEILGKSHPEYLDILKRQRDAFQEERAVELGTAAWKAVKTKPREALRSIKGLTGTELDNVRIGVVDRFMDNILQVDDAMTVINAVTRNKHQRELLEFAFGGKKEFGIFSRYAKRELAARNADRMTMYAGQSQTQRLQAAKDAGGDMAELAVAGASGLGFGGGTGMAANVARKIQHFATGVSENAQEKIAQILMSKGDDLVPRIKEVVEYMAARKAMNKQRGKWLGKAAQQPFTSEIGGE